MKDSATSGGDCSNTAHAGRAPPELGSAGSSASSKQQAAEPHRLYSLSPPLMHCTGLCLSLTPPRGDRRPPGDRSPPGNRRPPPPQGIAGPQGITGPRGNRRPPGESQAPAPPGPWPPGGVADRRSQAGVRRRSPLAPGPWGDRRPPGESQAPEGFGAPGGIGGPRAGGIAAPRGDRANAQIVTTLWAVGYRNPASSVLGCLRCRCRLLERCWCWCKRRRALGKAEAAAAGAALVQPPHGALPAWTMLAWAG